MVCSQKSWRKHNCFGDANCPLWSITSATTPSSSWRFQERNSWIKHRIPSGSRSVRITDGETAAGLKADLGQRKNSFPPFLGVSHFYVTLAFKAKPKLADLCMIIFLCFTPMNFTQWKVTRNIRWMWEITWQLSRSPDVLEIDAVVSSFHNHFLWLPDQITIFLMTSNALNLFSEVLQIQRRNKYQHWVIL